MTRPDAQEALDLLAQQAEACRACPLGGTRTQAVFSRGSAGADVMFVGEAPGFNEDREGAPFVGKAGQLLDKLIREHLHLEPDEVYVANTLKCRPPDNRDPRPEEITACRHFLEAQVRLVRPKVIVPLGNFAAKLLLETTTGITRLRGRRFSFPGGAVIPTFHPAAALRGRSAMEGIEEDFGIIREALEEFTSQDAGSETQPAGGGGGPSDEPPGQQLGLF